MHAIYRVFFVVILFAVVCNHQGWAQNKNISSCSGFVLKIVKEGGKGDTVRLLYPDCSEQGRDTILVLNGPATKHGLLEGATEAILFTDIHNRLLDGPRVIRFIIEPGQMNLSFSVLNDTARNIKITGSASQTEKEKWEKSNADLFDQHYYNSLLESYSKNENDPELQKLYKRKIDSVYEKRLAAAMLYIKAHPNSYFSGYLLNRYKSRIPLDSSQVYYSNFTKRVKQSQFGKAILSDVLVRSSDLDFRKKNSDPAFFSQFKKIRSFHDLSLPDINGQVNHLAALKGRYVVVDFWGSWCGPCFENIPHLKKLVDEMKGMPVEFVSISIDTDIGDWKKAMAKHHFPGLNLVDTLKLAASYYKVPWVPKYIIVKPDGSLACDDAPHPISGDLKPLLISIINKKD